MKIKCEYCDEFINDYDERCPNCGGINAHLVRNANDAPKTIEQLKQWYKDMNLPNEYVTRFFIGTNFMAPKAFGIYKDESTGNFVVYKNNSDGQRNIRYEGKDEAYAVNELYLKLKQEIVNQKANNVKRKNSYSSGNILKNNSQSFGQILGDTFLYGLKRFVITFIIVFAILAIVGFIYENTHKNNKGYYGGGSSGHYNSYNNYSSYNSRYDDYSSYSSRNDDYSSYSSRDNDYSSSSSSYDDTWDSSSSWDSSDSWSSSSTDWDSDW